MSDNRPPGIDGRRVDDKPADRTAYGTCPYDGATLRLITVRHGGDIRVDLYCPMCP